MATKLMSSNHGAGLAATMAGRANEKGRGFVSGLYPITPSTECMEFICEQTFTKGHVVRVEGEHSAMGVCIGASEGGARTFTTTSSNGLIYMAENVYAAAMQRLPVVMAVANRTVGPPWNIWLDHGDSLMLRDMGWIQIYCADNQEVFDTVLAAFRLAEDNRLLMPVMVCQDGFVLSHTIAQIDVPEQETVNSFLPLLDLPHRVTGENKIISSISPPHTTEVHRRDHQEAMGRVKEVYKEVQAEFKKTFGRTLKDPLDTYLTEDADTLILSLGTMGQTVERFCDTARAKGEKVGAVRIRMLRPFPEEELKALFKGKKRIAILDRAVSLGYGGVLWTEIRGLADGDCVLQSYVIGAGGGDVRPEHIEEINRDLGKRTSPGEAVFMEVG